MTNQSLGKVENSKRRSHDLKVSVLDLLALLVFYVLISIVPVYLFLFYFLHDGSLTVNSTIESLGPLLNILMIFIGVGIMYFAFRKLFRYPGNVFLHGIAFSIFYVFIYSFLLMTGLHDLILSGPGPVLSGLFLIFLYYSLVNLFLVYQENRARTETFHKKAVVTFSMYLVMLFVFIYWYGYVVPDFDPDLNFRVLTLLLVEFLFMSIISTLVFYKLFFWKDRVDSRKIAYSPVSLFLITLGSFVLMFVFEALTADVLFLYFKPLPPEIIDVVSTTVRSISFFTAAFVYMAFVSLVFGLYKRVVSKIRSKA
ncbi:hypothetical protein MsAg5_12510 [Methanosarcinaceae archaeon Ag5]|uniref:Uncharacterized protein n=1 Tax=Methanolapillus africanus TaxID=3028297 RepID=A0AAE4MKA7_9EURY|nr:hypothetical protein [Methanosarcinaceae archaeon Ag5]